jgi:hypothetical protein
MDNYLDAKGEFTKFAQSLIDLLDSRGYVDGDTLLERIAGPLSYHVNSVQQRVQSLLPTTRPVRDRETVQSYLAERGFDDVNVDNIMRRVHTVRQQLLQRLPEDTVYDNPNLLRDIVSLTLADELKASRQEPSPVLDYRAPEPPAATDPGRRVSPPGQAPFPSAADLAASRPPQAAPRVVNKGTLAADVLMGKYA